MTRLRRSGSTKAPSSNVGHLAAAVHVKCLELGVRIWYASVDSKSNPADGLSRAGLSDQWTREQSWHLHEVGPEMMDRIAEYVRSPTLARLIGPLADVSHRRSKLSRKERKKKQVHTDSGVSDCPH